MRRPFWGRGLASEAGAAAIKTAFEELEIDEGISLIDRSNDRSLAVAERLGMHHARDVSHLEIGVLSVYILGRREWRTSRNR